jgi:hypothetical protein
MRIRAGVAPAAARLGSSRYGPDCDFARAISDPELHLSPILMSGSGPLRGFCDNETWIDRGTTSSTAVQRSRHRVIDGGAARRSYGPRAIGTSFGTLRTSVARSRSLRGRALRQRSSLFAGTSYDGETRTRTGDTTIFRESWARWSHSRRTCKQHVPTSASWARHLRFGSVAAAFGTPRRLRSPNGWYDGTAAPPSRSCRTRCRPVVAHSTSALRRPLTDTRRAGRARPPPSRRGATTRLRSSSSVLPAPLTTVEAILRASRDLPTLERAARWEGPRSSPRHWPSLPRVPSTSAGATSEPLPAADASGPTAALALTRPAPRTTPTPYRTAT